MMSQFGVLILVGALMGVILGLIAGFVWFLIQLGKKLDEYGDENGQD